MKLYKMKNAHPSGVSVGALSENPFSYLLLMVFLANLVKCFSLPLDVKEDEQF